MPIISSELSEHFERCYGDYVKEIQRERGYENLRKYLREFDGLPADKTNRTSLMEAIKDYSMAPLTRFFPENDQRVAIVAANPGLASNPRFYLEGEGAALHEADGDPRKMARVSKNYLPEYLTRNDNSWDKLVNILQTEVPNLPNPHTEVTTSEYLQEAASRHPHEPLSNSSRVDHDTGFFSDVYYTNAYKFATNGTTDVDNWDFGVPYLSKELQTVSPDLVVCTSKLSWQMVLSGCDRNQVNGKNNAPVTTSWYKIPDNTQVDKARYSAYKTENFAIANIRHPARGINTDQTTATIKSAVGSAF